MNNPDTIKTLTDYNAWRRGCEQTECPQPTDIGHAIDSAIKHLEMQTKAIETLKKKLKCKQTTKHSFTGNPS
jgi:hypothetical protein